MKTVYLMRHAKSSWEATGLSDHQRVLDSRGRADAPRIANWLAEKKERIDLILSSDSARTTETSEHLKKAYPNTPIQYTRSLYLASAQEIHHQIQETDDSLSNILILAHNPGITNAFELLADMQIDNVPTSGIGKFTFNVRSFRDIELGGGQLVFFNTPKKLLFGN